MNIQKLNKMKTLLDFIKENSNLKGEKIVSKYEKYLDNDKKLTIKRIEEKSKRRKEWLFFILNQRYFKLIKENKNIYFFEIEETYLKDLFRINVDIIVCKYSDTSIRIDIEKDTLVILVVTPLSEEYINNGKTIPITKEEYMNIKNNLKVLTESIYGRK